MGEMGASQEAEEEEVMASKRHTHSAIQARRNRNKRSWATLAKKRTKNLRKRY
jgi:hypothetical protein